MFNEKIIKKTRYCRIYLFTLQNNHLLIQIISYEKKANFSCDCSQLYFFGNSPK